MIVNMDQLLSIMLLTGVTTLPITTNENDIIHPANSSTEPTISCISGAIGDTQVNIKAEVFVGENMNESFVHLTCSSCRQPYGHYVEFLINNKSEDSIRFDPNSNRCLNSAAVFCDPANCNCSGTENSFDIVLNFKETDIMISCEMIFTDDMIGSRFKKIATVYVNKIGIYTLPTRTVIIKQSASNSTDPGETKLPATTVENNLPAQNTPDSTVFPSETMLPATTVESNLPAENTTDSNFVPSETTLPATTVESNVPAQNTTDSTVFRSETTLRATTVENILPAQNITDSTVFHRENTLAATTVENILPAQNTTESTVFHGETTLPVTTIENNFPTENMSYSTAFTSVSTLSNTADKEDNYPNNSSTEPIASCISGAIDDTQVNITARVFIDNMNKSFVHLRCSSCRPPYGHYVEFLINNTSEDSIRFDPNSNRCLYSAGVVCDPSKCNCSETGKSFEKVVEKPETDLLISCDMIFTDDLVGSRFKKIASVYVNKSGVYTLPTKTVVIKQPVSNSTDPGIYTLPTTTAMIKMPSPNSTAPGETTLPTTQSTTDQDDNEIQGVSSLHSTTVKVEHTANISMEPINASISDQNSRITTMIVATCSYLLTCFLCVMLYTFAYCLKKQIQLFNKCSNLRECLPWKSPVTKNFCFWILSCIYLSAIILSAEYFNWPKTNNVYICVKSFVFGCVVSILFIPGYEKGRSDQQRSIAKRKTVSERENPTYKNSTASSATSMKLLTENPSRNSTVSSVTSTKFLAEQENPSRNSTASSATSTKFLTEHENPSRNSTASSATSTNFLTERTPTKHHTGSSSLSHAMRKYLDKKRKQQKNNRRFAAYGSKPKLFANQTEKETRDKPKRRPQLAGVSYSKTLADTCQSQEQQKQTLGTDTYL